jgi:hypothetical protein
VKAEVFAALTYKIVFLFVFLSKIANFGYTARLTDTFYNYYSRKMAYCQRFYGKKTPERAFFYMKVLLDDFVY